MMYTETCNTNVRDHAAHFTKSGDTRLFFCRSSRCPGTSFWGLKLLSFNSPPHTPASLNNLSGGLMLPCWVCTEASPVHAQRPPRLSWMRLILKSSAPGNAGPGVAVTRLWELQANCFLSLCLCVLYEMGLTPLSPSTASGPSPAPPTPEEPLGIPTSYSLKTLTQSPEPSAWCSDP